MMRLSVKRGFTLSELMLAAAILLVAILALLAVFISGVILNESNNNMVAAVNDAQYCLEQMKGLAYADLAAYAAPAFNNLNGEAVSISRSIGASIATVTVTVSWTERGRARSVSLPARFAR
jgi:Tfp pilus assembly protein PilE